MPWRRDLLSTSRAHQSSDSQPGGGYAGSYFVTLHEAVHLCFMRVPICYFIEKNLKKEAKYRL